MLAARSVLVCVYMCVCVCDQQIETLFFAWGLYCTPGTCHQYGVLSQPCWKHLIDRQRHNILPERERSPIRIALLGLRYGPQLGLFHYLQVEPPTSG
jgi:hypothetical protein